MAQVARRLAERLKLLSARGVAAELVDLLDVDAVEAASLAHDLGHPPFGHLAEEELTTEASEFGGFEGNAQSFRILTRLALRSVDAPGLNLTRQSLNAVVKYPWLRDPSDDRRSKKWAAYDADREYFKWVREGTSDAERSLEAELMDWADDVTYAVHDMDDFYRAGLVPLDRLCQPGSELEQFQAYVRVKHTDDIDSSEAEGLVEASERLFRQLLSVDSRYEGRAEERVNLRAVGSALITRYIEAVTVTSGVNIGWFEIDDLIRREVAVLKELTWYYVIERPSLAIIQQGHRQVIRELYNRYFDAASSGRRRDLHIFPPAYAEGLRTADTDAARGRVVIDLVASTTEGSALEVYRRMSGISTGSLLGAAGRIA